MDVLPARRRRLTRRGRTGLVLVLGACVNAGVFSADASAQTFGTSAMRSAAHKYDSRGARSVGMLRPVLVSGQAEKRDYGIDLDSGPSIDETDTAQLEGRINDLAAKVRELSEALREHQETGRPTHFSPRPMRVTLLEEDRAVPIPKTYGEALRLHIRDRVRAMISSFGDAEQSEHLAFQLGREEVSRLLEPVYPWLSSVGTPEEVGGAYLRAIIYVTLLETRAKLECPEPLPALHKLLRDFRVDRVSLAAHLARSVLPHRSYGPRELGVVLDEAAAAHPEMQSVRDFSKWMAHRLGTDLEGELAEKVETPYHSDPDGQFDAAAENAVQDGADLLKVQVELQRMLVEAKGLKESRQVNEDTASSWEHRLLRAERDLDHLQRSVASEREAVTTLARRASIEMADLPIVESDEEANADGLTTQH